MIRRAYTIQLAPGAFAEYKEKHDNIWPELVEEFGRQGIAQLTAFSADPVIFYYAEVEQGGRLRPALPDGGARSLGASSSRT